MPRISIGLPVRNGAAYLQEALNALLAQTYQDFELIISDNGSKDRTAEICQDAARSDRRIRYFRQNSVLPPSENHNFALHRSKAEFFRWNSYDDLCAPQFLEKCLQALQNDTAAVLAYPQTAIIDTESREVGQYSYPLRTADPRSPVRFGSVLRADHRRFAGFQIYGLMRRRALAAVPDMGNYVSADRVLLARLALQGRFVEVPERLFFSREHDKRSVRMLPAGISAERRWLRRIIGVGALPPLEWWDPSKARRINFPEWRLIREYYASVNRAPLSGGEKAACGMEVLHWFVSDIPKLGRDILISAERWIALRQPGVGRPLPHVKAGS